MGGWEGWSGGGLRGVGVGGLGRRGMWLRGKGGFDGCLGCGEAFFMEGRVDRYGGWYIGNLQKSNELYWLMFLN